MLDFWDLIGRLVFIFKENLKKLSLTKKL